MEERDADYYELDDEERGRTPNAVLVDRDTGEFYYVVEGGGRIYQDNPFGGDDPFGDD